MKGNPWRGALSREMRLRPAIPLIIEKLKTDSGFLAEECVYAVSGVGTDTVAKQS